MRRTAMLKALDMGLNAAALAASGAILTIGLMVG